jgi:hypothetical protein
MGRVVIVVAPGAGFGPEAVASAWNADREASAAGTAVVEDAGGEVFFPGLVELVAVPLAVNVTSSVVYDLVKKLAGRLRRPGGGDEAQVERPEFLEVTGGGGDVIIVIRGGDGLR